MPEIRFQIELPDGSQATCYSPSLIVKEYFTPGDEYTLADFIERSRIALHIASDRVQAKYGSPCGSALGQLAQIEALAEQYSQVKEPKVRMLKFIE